MPLQGVINYPPLPPLPAVLAHPLHLFKRQHRDREIELVVGEPRLVALPWHKWSGAKKARVALARKLATSLHCLGQDGTTFLWTTDATA
jgi:hypothetical protein